VKAWLVEATDGTMRFAETPEPVAGPEQYVIEIEAAGLNFLDALMLRGLYQVKPKLPFTPGVEAIGRIIAGDGQPAGTRVIASLQGAYAERAVVEAKSIALIEDGVPAPEAMALFGVAYCTSWHGLHNRAKLQPGETVLVHAAAGGVGSAAVQIALAAGARVIATAGGPDKCATALALGAEIAIDYGSEDWVDQVKAATGGRGADVIYDPVGGSVGERSLRCLAWHGRYLIVGFAAGQIPALAANRIMLKEAAAMGVYWGGAVAGNPAVAGPVRAAILALYRTGAVAPLIRGRFPLERADEALALLAGRGSVGKVVLTRN
jgi:NADPH2:quinone reductase